MKKFTGLVILVIATCFELQAQHAEGNPFARLGYKTDVYTFGEKKEFHDQEEIVEIGEILFNTKTNEVVGFVEEKTDSLIELKPELQSMSIDPLCEKYYSISPYAYCMNNPVKYIDPDGKDWIVANGTTNYEWRNDITSKSTMPEGYQYVGSANSDILTHLGLNYSFPTLNTNKLGSIASDAELGRYAISHMVNVKENSNATIDTNISYNNGEKVFNGVQIKVIEVSSSSNVDGNLESNGMVNVQYGSKTYTSTLKTPNGAQVLPEGSSVKTSTIDIPKAGLSTSSKLSQIQISGNWWVSTPGGQTPVTIYPGGNVLPIPISFKHTWTVK